MRAYLPNPRLLIGVLLLAGGISVSPATPATFSVYRFDEELGERPTLEQLQSTGNPTWSWTAELASGKTVALQYGSAGQRVSLTFNPEQIGDSWFLNIQFNDETDLPEGTPGARTATRGSNTRVRLQAGQSTVMLGLAGKLSSPDEQRSKSYFLVVSLGSP